MRMSLTVSTYMFAMKGSAQVTMLQEGLNTSTIYFLASSNKAVLHISQLEVDQNVNESQAFSPN